MSPAKAATKKISKNKSPKEGGHNIDSAIEVAFDLKLYVAGQTPRSIQAFENLKRICEEHLPGRYRIVVIDLLKNPQLARGDQILAIPTLVRALPQPVRKIIGDLSNRERVLVGLNIERAQ